MDLTVLKSALISTCLLAAVCSAQNTPIIDNTADLILQGAKVYTFDKQRSWAEAVAIKDGKIVYVGNQAGANAYRGDKTKLADLKGKMLLPAFQDTHIHPIAGGLAYDECPLFDLKTLEQVLSTIKDCANKYPDKDYIIAKGWTWGIFGITQPNKKLLDNIDTQRPIITEDADGHTLWVNSAALALGGVTATSSVPEGGAIGKDVKTGEPIGTLMEGPAMGLIYEQLPATTIEQETAALLFTQSYLHSLGITAIQDAFIEMPDSNPNKSLQAYAALRDSGKLKLRVSAALGWKPGKGVQQIETMMKAREQFSNGRLRVNSVKFWADGIIETHTALLLEPYSDQPDVRGFLMMPLKEIEEGTQQLDAKGFQLHIHAIGDGTVRMALNVFENAREVNGVRDARHLTHHTQLIHPDDIPRFGKLDVIAGFSPYWAYADEYISVINPPQLGAERMSWIYPINGIIKQGGRIAFGSDWSVSTADPLLAIETAVTRSSPEGESTPPLNPTEAITLEQALAAYTIDAAYTNFIEDETGSIEVGKYADLIILSDNLFDIPVTEISAAKVSATLMEGEVVYGAIN
ncbi:MAG: amidohydrolase [Proteobacteria bacterium]|nr:amidohydrolase [Pseudomonadota bacterium]